MIIKIINSQFGIQQSVVTLRELDFASLCPLDLALKPQQLSANARLATQLRNDWKKYGKAVTFAVRQLARQERGVLQHSYQCVVTPFGTQGYYHTPSTIFISSQAKHPDSPFLTLLHELTHLILFERTKGCPTSTTEKSVDAAVRKYFLAIVDKPTQGKAGPLYSARGFRRRSIF